MNMPAPCVVLHVCCAGCAEACVERLAAEHWRIILFFSNSNIAPRAEYERRLHDFRRLCADSGLEGIVDEYRPEAWRAAVRGLEQEPERGRRCDRCFAFRLDRTHRVMQARGAGAFTTTLTVSPHKRSAQVFRAGQARPGFLPLDFKKRDGFRRSVACARRKGYHRQTWCGCAYSRREQGPGRQA